MNKKQLLWAGLLLALLTAAALLLFLSRPVVKFNGERGVRSDPPAFALRFTVMNTEDAETLSLREGDRLRVAWQIDSGSVDVTISLAKEEPLYRANDRGNGDAAYFELLIPQSGDYTVSVTGRDARGWLSFEKTDGE